MTLYRYFNADEYVYVQQYEVERETAHFYWVRDNRTKTGWRRVAKRARNPWAQQSQRGALLHFIARKEYQLRRIGAEYDAVFAAIKNARSQLEPVP